MPWPKRAAVLAAVVTAVGLLAVASLLIARGHHLAGGGLLAGTLLLAALALEVFWVSWDLTTGSLRTGRRDSSRVALTFDDGPGPDTPAVLDALDGAGARATFFVLGRHAAERPGLVREIARRGHVVALHGHTHRKLHLAGPRTAAAEIDGGRDAIRAAGVEPAPFFRAPHGFKGPILGRELRRRGLTLVAWTRGVWDTERPGAEAIAERASGAMRGGEILLLHDGCGTQGIDPRRDQTAAAIPEIVRRWREAGYEFVTVDRLEPGAPTLSRERVLRLAGLALVVAFAAVAMRRLDGRAILDAFAGVRVTPLVLAALCNVAALAAQSLRWLAVAHPAAPRARPWDAFYSTVTGFAVGLVMPARAADVAKSHLLARRSDASMARSPRAWCSTT
jgi:peptidoglycan/xylan/chitin deacetylase (PgdA/CDA1 family)